MISSMDPLEDLRDQLRSRAASHPVLVRWWSEYVSEAHKAYTDACEQAQVALRDMDSVRDPGTAGEIIAMCALAQE
mgnify:CR=1 FL=1